MSGIKRLEPPKRLATRYDWSVFGLLAIPTFEILKH